MDIVGRSGHIELRLDEERVLLEDVELGELLILPDLATVCEVHKLLGEAITRMTAGE